MPNQEHVATKSAWLSPVLLIPLLFVVFVLVIGVSTYFTTVNKAVRSESAITAQYRSNQNLFGQYTLKVQESLGITKMYSKDFEKVMAGALSARYGDEGSKAAWSWIQEAYPGQFDASMYKEVQHIITAGRNDFTVSQDLLIDRVRVYENDIKSPWSGFWLRLAGYPTIKLDDYNPVISQQAKQSFETKIDPGVKIE